jgi:pyridoxal phosphate enzyme (YggS family)
MVKFALAQLNGEIESTCGRLCKPKPKLVLISKSVTDDKILEAYSAGHRIFGENKVQELILKKERLPQDIEWHFVGHVQTNKVKLIVGQVALIHSVDSARVAEAIDREAAKKGLEQPCLLQVNVSREDAKSGIDPDVAAQLFETVALMQHIKVDGLMTIGAFVNDERLIRENFKELFAIKDKINSSHTGAHLTELSMGMSTDWKIAIEEGATYLRIGSLVFGER